MKMGLKWPNYEKGSGILVKLPYMTITIYYPYLCAKFPCPLYLLKLTYFFDSVSYLIHQSID